MKLSMTEQEFKSVCNRFSSLLILKDDAEEALAFAQELLEAEIDAVKKREPSATTTIQRLEAAAHELEDLKSAIAGDEFNTAQ